MKKSFRIQRPAYPIPQRAIFLALSILVWSSFLSVQSAIADPAAARAATARAERAAVAQAAADAQADRAAADARLADARAAKAAAAAAVAAAVDQAARADAAAGALDPSNNHQCDPNYDPNYTQTAYAAELAALQAADAAAAADATNAQAQAAAEAAADAQATADSTSADNGDARINDSKPPPAEDSLAAAERRWAGIDKEDRDSSSGAGESSLGITKEAFSNEEGVGETGEKEFGPAPANHFAFSSPNQPAKPWVTPTLDKTSGEVNPYKGNRGFIYRKAQC